MTARMTKRQDGRYVRHLRVTDPVTGERKRRSFYGETQAEVTRKVKEAQERIEAGAPIRDASCTVGQWCAQWRDSTLEASNRKETTKALYRSMSRTHLENGVFSTIPLNRLRPTDVDAFVTHLRRAGKKRSTTARIFSALRVVLDDAVRDQLIARNPARQVKPPTVERGEVRHLSAEDVERLLASTAGTRCHRPLCLIAALGLRKGEALALRWDDVTLAGSNPSIKVRGTLARVNGELIVTAPKTARSRRTLPLSRSVVTLLEAQRTEQAEDRLRAANIWDEYGFVFTTETGRPIDPSNILREIKRAARKAGLSSVTVHTLRHSAATVMLEGGVHLRGVADLLGHADIRTTAEVYGHLSDEVARSAMNGLSAAFKI